MKILIVSPYRTVAPHFENELEIAQRIWIVAIRFRFFPASVSCRYAILMRSRTRVFATIVACAGHMVCRS